MATTRIKDISSTVTSLASDDYLAVDGATNGTRKMVRGSIYTDVAAAFTGAPTTYDICPLNSGTGKIDATYLPTSGDTPKGEWNASTNSPSLIDGTGTAGDYYDVTTAGSQDLGSGSITFTVGDVVKYDGSVWYKIDSVANILDGSATAADGRSALSVNSIDEDAEATGTKLVGPALYFDGVNDYLEVADDAKLSFTDGTDDLPFSVSVWVKPVTGSDQIVFSKYGSTAATREFYASIGSSNNALLRIYSTTAAGYVSAYTPVNSLTDGAWNQIVYVYKGAGPNSDVSFTSAYSDSTQVIDIYINGVKQTLTQSNYVGFSGMSNTAQVVQIGRNGAGNYFKGHIRNVQLFNRELTADEVAELAKGNELGFADELGDHTSEMLTDGGFETWASGTDLTNWTEGGAVSVAQESVDIQSGTYSCQITGGGTIVSYASNWLSQNAGISSGKRYRFTGKVKRVSGSTDSLEIGVRYYKFVTFNGTTFTVNTNATYMPEARIVNQASLGSGWYSVTVEFVTFAGALNELVFGVTGATDPYLIDDCSVVQVGTLADFRSERFDSSTGKWYDLSDNAFVGTNNGATLVGREVPVYETGTWTPSITFGGGSTAITYTTQEGLYTRVGNTVWVSAYVLLSAKGSDTGTALINGLPFTASNTAASSQSFTVGNAANAANLTSAITAYATDNGTTINLVDWGATGSAVLDDTNFAATTALSISGTYQIQ